MAVAFRAISTATGTDASVAGTIPSGTTTGDFMVAFICAAASSTTVTGTPSGWALQEADPNPQDFSLWCYSKAWAASEPAPTWTMSAAGNWTVDIVSYSGCDTTTPVNVDIGATLDAVNALAVGPITPTVNNCMLLTFGAVDATGTVRSWTEDGAMTERLEQLDNAMHRVVAEEMLSGGSGVGQTRTLTVSGTAQAIGGFLLALAPAAGGVTVEGDATLTGTATVTAVAAVTRETTATLTGTATVTVDGDVIGGVSATPILVMARSAP